MCDAKSILSCVSNWVLLKVKEIQKFVGMSCEGYEEQFFALLTAVRSSHANSKNSSSREMELKKLTCSINYVGSARRDRTKGKRIAHFL